MTVPYWVQDVIFYQIFPDRFANRDPGNDPPNKQPLNPIFKAASTHRYDTVDYFAIDPKPGDLQGFHALVIAAHRNDVHIL